MNKIMINQIKMYFICLILINHHLIYNIHQINVIQLDLTLWIIDNNSWKIKNKLQVQNFVLCNLTNEINLIYI